MTQKILSPATTIHQQKLKEHLKAKRASIRAIDRGTNADAMGNFKRSVRAIESGEYGTPRAFLGCFISGFGTDRKIHKIAFGVASPEEQEMAVRHLQEWVRSGTS
jgi:hypothetical protein